MDAIFKASQKHFNNYLVQLIRKNHEINGDHTVVAYGFKFRGKCYFNPSLTFSFDKDKLSTLHKSLEEQVREYNTNCQSLLTDKEVISQFLTIQGLFSKSEEDFFNNIPSIFDNFIKKVCPSFERQMEPEIPAKLTKLYDKVTHLIDYYASFELLT